LIVGPEEEVAFPDDSDSSGTDTKDNKNDIVTG